MQCDKCGKRTVNLKRFFINDDNHLQRLMKYCLDCYLQQFKDEKQEQKDQGDPDQLLFD